MSRLAEDARAASREKANRMAGDHEHVHSGSNGVDGSTYQPTATEPVGAQTGKKPVPRRFKRGGKVSGEAAKARADKAPRKGPKRHHEADGGSFVPTERFGFSPTTGSAIVKNLGMKRGGGTRRTHRDSGGDVLAQALSPAYMAAKNPKGVLNALSPISNLKRGGTAKARKHGGKADAHWIKEAVGHKGALHRDLHVPEGKKIPAKKLEKAEHSSNKLVAKRAQLAETLEHMGDRRGRKSGGRAKGKMDVNIIIGDRGGTPQGQPMAPPMPPPMPPHPPMPMPAPAMGGPPGGPPPIPPQIAAALAAQAGQGGPPPMARRRGGRTPHMTAGAGSGLGRLEKAGLR